MNFMHIVYKCMCALFISFPFHQGIATDNKQCGNGEKGSISSCYNTHNDVIGKVDLELKWSPTNITGNETYAITVKKLDAPDGTTFENGTALITVNVPFLDKPLYNKTQSISCKELLGQVLKILPHNDNKYVESFCPIKFPEITVVAEFIKDLPFNLPAEIPIPMGSYNITLKVFNEDHLDGQNLFLCLHGWLIFSHVEDCAKDEVHKSGNTIQDFVSHLFGNPSGKERDDL